MTDLEKMETTEAMETTETEAKGNNGVEVGAGLAIVVAVAAVYGVGRLICDGIKLTGEFVKFCANKKKDIEIQTTATVDGQPVAADVVKTEETEEESEETD